MRWQDLPIVGGSYRDDTRPWSVQDTINFIPVQAERSGTRSPALLRCAPGFSTFSAGAQSSPCRGMHNVEGTLYGVVGDKLYTWGIDGTATSLGTIPGVERVSMAHNQIAGGNQIAIAANNAGYVYDTVAGTLTQITDDGFPGSIQFGYLAQSILGIDPSRNFAFWSDVADATSYNSLDRVQAEAAPDKLVGMAVTHSEWWLFGERTIQPFYINVNASAQGDAFLPMNNTVIEVGCGARDSIVNMDNSVFWLGNDGIVYRANGYTPQRISTHAVEQAIAKCNRNAAFAFTFEDRGHKIYYLTFPDGETWGYDAASGEWARRQSYGLSRWRLNDLVYWNNQWIGADYANGKLYALDWGVQTEDGYTLERRRITPVIADSQNPIIVNGFEVVVDNGEAQKTVPTSIVGHLPVGHLGDAVSYRYQVIAQSRPAPVTVSAGAIPNGVVLDTDGDFSGSFTSTGTFAWTAKVTDGDGQTAQLNDSATVTLYLSGIWGLLGTTNNTTMDFSTSPDSWPISRAVAANFNVKQTSPAWDGTAICLPTSTPANSAVAIKTQDAGVSGSISVTVASLGANYGRVYGFPGIFVASHGVSGTYAYSTDHGATWVTASSPSGLQLSGIARLNSGRWIAYFQLNSVMQLYYSDAATPTAWVLALGSISGTGGYDIACDGVTGVFTNNIGTVWTTTDGATWTSHAGVYPSIGGSAAQAILRAIGPGVFLGSALQSAPQMALSMNSGLTWTQITLTGETTSVAAINNHGNTVAVETNANQYISSNLGATWVKAAAAPLSRAVIAYFGDP